jgi:hypothetical protein
MRLRVLQEQLQEAIVRGTPSDVPGVAIYQHAYRTRVVEALRSIFPALLEATGETLFDHFALAFLDAVPPRGHSLDALAPAFACYLAETRPSEAWTDIIIELATMEAAFHEVYDGPDATRLFRLAYPVHEYLLAVRRGDRPALPTARRAFVAMTRRDYRVIVRELPEDQFEALSGGGVSPAHSDVSS